MKKYFLLIVLAYLVFAFLRGTGTDYYEIAKNKISEYKPSRKDYVIIVDYRKTILQDRLYVIDMKTGEKVIESKVSHAFYSGILSPVFYSNKNGTNMTSKGCFITMGHDYGQFGYSMVIEGKDMGINNNAKSRAIIFHSTKKMTYPWSKGCFATPEETNRKIIDLTKNGCLVVVLS